MSKEHIEELVIASGHQDRFDESIYGQAITFFLTAPYAIHALLALPDSYRRLLKTVSIKVYLLDKDKMKLDVDALPSAKGISLGTADRVFGVDKTRVDSPDVELVLDYTEIKDLSDEQLIALLDKRLKPLVDKKKAKGIISKIMAWGRN